MQQGRRTGPTRTLDTARALFASDLAHLPADARRITAPASVPLTPSDGLAELSRRARAEALERAGIDA
jgi:hypothetical protein